MKFPTMTEMAKEVAEKALDDYEYQGKTIRQWIDILKDYDDKQATLQRIVERLKAKQSVYEKSWNEHRTEDDYGAYFAVTNAIQIVKEECGVK